MAVLFSILSIWLCAVSATSLVQPITIGLDLKEDEPRRNDVHQNVSDTSSRNVESRYQPDLENQYHLFTRANPTVSQPLVTGNWGALALSNYNPDLWTVVLIHGRSQDATSPPVATMVPAFLQAEPCNVIAVDWRNGALEGGDMMNAVYSGQSIARFLTWLITATGGSLDRVHVAGYSLGAHCAANMGRAMGGQLAYITGLDPAYGDWPESEYKFQPNDAKYTEVIHTGSDDWGYPEPLAQVDFYPNGGSNMPGCDNIMCDHGRSFYYFAESVSGGTFTGTRCESYEDARESNCSSDDTLIMGGNRPKTGASGIFWLETNAGPPFAKG